MKDWNTHPKPFIWTKSADEILESLGRLLKRISGAEYSRPVDGLLNTGILRCCGAVQRVGSGNDRYAGAIRATGGSLTLLPSHFG